MKDQYVVYDLETYSESDSEKIEDTKAFAVAVTKSFDSREVKVWYASDVQRLVSYLLSFPRIVGFNIKQFDNVILTQYSQEALPLLNAKSIDLLEMIERKLGHRISLESVAGPTLKKSKTMDGEAAIRLWKSGRKEEVISYCKEDVDLTHALFDRVLRRESLLYKSMGQLRSVQLDLEHNALDPRNFNYKVIDNGLEIEIDKTNDDFFRAVQLATNTNENIYLTGKAGTGKTTFLKYLKSNLRKNTAVVAYTGVAAVNAGGQTIHSFFKINPFEPPFIPGDPRLRMAVDRSDENRTTVFSHFQYNKARLEIFKALEVLIIDEVSMLRADHLDVIDCLLRAFGRRSGRSKPFGGVQVILIGDVFQLPPIEGREWTFLRRFYSSPFFFDSLVFQQQKPTYIELKKIYRQKEPEFIDLLNHIRTNNPSNDDLAHLNSKVRPFSHSIFDQNYIALCSTNAPANQINKMKLANLDSPHINYRATITGNFPSQNFPTEEVLSLKEGAQIMFLKNSKNYYNGKIGKLAKITDNSIKAVISNSEGEQVEIEIEKFTWQNIRYQINSRTGQIQQEILGSFTQYPIKLAWAITVHKSQGMTFEKVLVNINDFAPSGLVYVALSRCTSFENLIIRHPIRRGQIKTDPRVVAFASTETPATLVEERLAYSKADALYRASRNALRKENPAIALQTFLAALQLKDPFDESKTDRWLLCYSSKLKQHERFFRKAIGESKQIRKDMKVFLLLKLEELCVESSPDVKV